MLWCKKQADTGYWPLDTGYKNGCFPYLIQHREASSVLGKASLFYFLDIS